MMQVVCQWCGHRYTMKREAVLEALAEAQAAKAIHHVENCPKCRRTIKIQVTELKRWIPPGTKFPEVTKPEATGDKPKAE
ncbi:MAG TPA: hypothetical protein VJL59_14260 [Anaerolineales bacterium]|nr:hypothetical protein [Anaerolineales bacterium]